MSRVLTIEKLSIDIRAGGAGTRRVVNDVSLSIDSGRIAALVGESGSGKTLIGRSVMRLLPPVAALVGGDIVFNGASLTKLDETQMRSLRGRQIGAVFQEPMVSLNPALTIGFQMMEAMRLHERVSQAEARRRCMTMLEKVRIVDPEEALRAHPRQFSGGMRQRIMLASVLAMRPRLLIADEPTTALDALIRKEIMDLMVALTREIGTSVLLISHDLAMVAQYSDDVTVLRQGETVEQGSPAGMLLRPTHEYTRALMDALPARAPTNGVVRAPLVEINDLCVDFHRKRGLLSRRAAAKRAVDKASLSIFDGEVLAVVGESGSGKTTIGRTLLRLCDSSSGSIRFDGQDFNGMDADAVARFRTRTQMVFQDPFSSLDPRMTLGAAVAEGLRHVAGLEHGERLRRAAEILEEVGLPGAYVERYPHELSGGQRQRVCIARAVVARPRFIVADEPVSALDVTIQRQVLKLLTQLQEKYGFTYLFISHDLGVVEQMADRVAVMFRGRVLEVGPRNTIFDSPLHPYTMRLLEATPRLVRRADGAFELHTFPTRRQPAPAGHGYFNNGCIPGAPESVGAPLMIEVAAGHSVCCARAER
ncbi:dipeptide ABC transporter ATP-binding protein [Peristeroidobacter soli]|uniref:dipeptide ABC transporter ATP-binding protein n=1 Tax=Peristeroidobacter soli TaxID=2497877 RepID=UPI00101C3148|nr:ABC transporter ATP-binding protein [Peristeroidobacter soli]